MKKPMRFISPAFILLNGGFFPIVQSFVANITMDTDVSLDIRDMKEELLRGNRAEALRIYTEGERSHESLESLSLQHDFSNLPPFLIHLYGLRNPNIESQDYFAYEHYAHDHILALLNDKKSGTLAVDAIIVLSLWMRASYFLWEVLENCRYTSVDNLKNMERFMVTWLGSLHTSDKGNGLFAMTERASDMFGRMHRTANNHAIPISEVNIDLLKLHNGVVKLLEFDGTCRSFSGRPGFENMYHMVLQIQTKMTVPLMQMLISSLVEEDLPSIKLYALAIVPQISQCQYSKFEYLRDNLLNAKTLDKSEFGKIIAVLQSSIDCLGFKCEDVGTYKSGVLPQCVDVPPPFPLAGYHPSANVHQNGKIDLDILQIKILSEMQAWDHANLIYAYGKNSFITTSFTGDAFRYHTLKSMAKTKTRSMVTPFYQEFSTFYNDPHYADTIITQAFSGTGQYTTVEAPVRIQTIVLTLQYQVQYMYAMTYLEGSVGDCYSQDPARRRSMIQSWDISAAYLIGSLEGEKLGGSPGDGMLLYQLSNTMCKEFGTCSGNGWSKVATLYQYFLRNGKDEMAGPDCDSLAQTADKIKHIVMVPVLQSIIWYAIRNQFQDKKSDAIALVEGEVMTRAVLPIVNSYNSISSDVLIRNMIMEPGQKPVQDGPQEVANALYDIVDDFGIKCDAIGTYDGISVCKSESKSSGLSHTMNIFVVIAVAFISGLLSIIIL